MVLVRKTNETMERLQQKRSCFTSDVRELLLRAVASKRDVYADKLVY